MPASSLAAARARSLGAREPQESILQAGAGRNRAARSCAYGRGMKAEPIPIDVGGRSLKISSPAKVMFPAAGVTKEELVRYYIAVGGGICAALRDRPTTRHRFPDGGGGGAPDWVQKVRIQFPSGRYAEEVCPTEPAVFAWAANLGTVEFHPWPVRRPDVDHPDEMRIDFDPQPGPTFAD